MKNSKLNTLFKNTVMLYILQFSTYFLSLITVPYQTRILGPQMYGVIGMAVAVMTYFQLFMDFGFMLSATEDISKNRDDADYINRKFSSISVLKVFFSIISIVVMLLLSFIFPRFSEYRILYLIYILAYAANSFVPDFLYRGIEQMSAITIRTVLIKLFFTIMIFVVLKSPDDILIMPILLLIGNIGAVLFCYWHIFFRLGYRFVKVDFHTLYLDFKKALSFFFSRIATTIYSATNTIIIGSIDKTGMVTGYYSSADKVLTTAKNGLSPISDSLYPYMIKNKDFRLVKIILSVLMPFIALGCIVVFIFAEPICIFVFGKEFASVAPILQAFLPAILAILPSYILGFPTLGAMGLSKYANTSIIVGTTVHIIGMLIFFLFDSLNAVSLALMTSISEWSILIFRFYIVMKNKNIFGKK